MATALPLRPSIDHSPKDQSTLELTDDRTGAVLQALSSETARGILACIEETPGTASDIVEQTDTSMQNIQYHLSKLEDADLIAPVDTWYSSKGREMTVYAATADQFVIEHDGRTS